MKIIKKKSYKNISNIKKNNEEQWRTFKFKSSNMNIKPYQIKNQGFICFDNH